VPAASLTVSKMIKASDFPCSSLSPARVELKVNAEAMTAANQTVVTGTFELTHVATFNVMTYNIQEGWDLNHTVCNLVNTAAVIGQNDIDIALLQQVGRHWATGQECDSLDQIAELQRLTGMFAAYAPRLFRSGGDSGQLILSKFPIVRDSRVELKRVQRYIHIWPFGYDQEDTLSYQEVDIDVGGTVLRALNVHNCMGETDICPSWGDQWITIGDIVGRVSASRAAGRPVLLGGDFNAELAETDSTRVVVDSTFEHVCHLYASCVNWPVSSAGGVNHLFIWDDGRPRPKVLDGYVPTFGPFQPSDHLPLVARLAFDPQLPDWFWALF
jgi:endonuclease/exonuclease/phosphatase family metal-dependent hydrolase